MSLPLVAIVGRPNVGKSSLLNCLVGRRIAIVDSSAGVTRDRISAPVPAGDGYVELLDTGGVGIEDRDDLTEHVAGQIECAMTEAALILFVVDARDGLTPLDKTVAGKLRRQDKPVILVANKVDTPEVACDLGELAGLGFGEPLAVSATHRLGTQALLAAVAEAIGSPAQTPPEPAMKLAIVGKRNVGKSTFINALAGADRVIVSEVPGTTRDSVDVRIEMDGRVLLAIDTAGVRKRSKLADDIEFYSRHRALRSIRRADVVLFLLDATEPVGGVDKQLLAYVSGLFKPTVLVVNKWDLVAGRTGREDYGPYLTKMLPEFSYAPIVFASALEGTGVPESVALAGDLIQQARHRVPTAGLNEVVQEVTSRHAPRRGKSGRPPRVYYAAQIATAPPTLALVVSDVKAFDGTYRRYLLNQLRQRLPFSEVPIRLLFRPRRRRQAER